LKAVIKWLKGIFGSQELYAAAAVIIAACLLFFRPVTGVANNGDYGRIMEPAGIGFITDTRFTNIDRLFRIEEPVFKPGTSLITSHLLPVLVARALNIAVKDGRIFDIRFLGLVYLIIFAIGFYLLLKNNRTASGVLNIIFALLAVFILCDVGYLSYFNSFLGEAAIAVFFVLFAGIASHLLRSKRISIPLLLCFYLSAALFISAKQSNLPAGFIIAVLGLSVLLTDRRAKIAAAAVSFSVALICLSVFLYKATPENMGMITRHQTVFYGILKDSPTPEEDLEYLGLDKKLAVLKEASFYDADLPIPSNSELLKKEFYDKLTFSKVLGFYLHHPDRFVKKLAVTAENSTMIRTPYLGNYSLEDTGERFGFAGVFSLWSTAKKIYMPKSLLFIAAFFLIYLSAASYEFLKALRNRSERGKAPYAAMFLALWATGATQFVIPVLGDGEVDLPKHLFLYNLCFDLMLISAVIWLPGKLSALWRTFAGRMPGGGKRRIAVSAAAAAVVIIALAMLLREDIPEIGGNTTSEATLPKKVKTGDYVEFGSYRGERILWQAVQLRSGNVLLVSDRVLCFKPFDAVRSKDANADRRKFGSNDWETSSLRAWLNSDRKRVDYRFARPSPANVWRGYNSYDSEPGFLYGFSAAEKRAIRPVIHKSILSVFEKEARNGGSTYYLWTNCVPLLLENYDNSYYRNIEDSVFLPDVRDLKVYISDNGLDVRRAAAAAAEAVPEYPVASGGYAGYWLRTPYTTRPSFVRYVGSDGYVYHKDAYFGDLGVLPVLELREGCAAAEGDGSRERAFRLKLG
jgi:hypothetical protein